MPIYLLAGEETYLKREFLNKLRHQLIAPEHEDFDYEVFSGAENDLREVLDVARTHPVLAARRLIIVRNTEKYAPQENMLLAFVRQPVQHACVVLDTEKTLRDKFIQRLAESPVVCVTADRLEGRQLQHWISMFVRKEGKKISAAAIEALLSRSRPDMELLARSLRTVCQYKRDADTVEAEDISLVVSATRVESGFDLLNALMERRSSAALEMAGRLCQDGGDVIELIGLISWQIRQITSYRALAAEGLGHAQISKSLNTSQYNVRRLKEYAGRFNQGQLKRAAAQLLEADTAIKKGLKSPFLAFQMLIVEFCTPAATRS